MQNSIGDQNYVITPQQAKHAVYRTRLDEEIAAGKNMSLGDLKARRIEDPRIVRYKTKLAGGDGINYEAWLDPLISRFGPFQRCLSIGSGRGRVEQHLVDRGLCGKFDAYDVYLKESNKEEEATEFMDLNFARLEQNAYDLILCHGVLHHLINLEVVFEQINAALKPTGLLVVYEYVGENHWQFTEQRLALLKRYFPDVRLKPPARWQVGGFESVRSSDLPRIIEAVFGGTAVMSAWFGGIYFPFIVCTTSDQDHLLDKVIAYDQSVALTKELPPSYHLGAYRKSANHAPKATPWSDKTLIATLQSSMPLRHSLLSAMRKSAFGPTLRRIKRIIIGPRRG